MRQLTLTTFSAPSLKPGRRADGTVRDGSRSGDVNWPNRGRAHTVSLEEWARRLTTPFPAPAKFLAPSFCVATLEDGVRHKAKVQTCASIALDFDHGASVGQVCERLRPFAFVVYTTSSHRPESHRLRAWLPLQRTVNASEYAAVLDVLSRRFDAPPDPQAKDPCRLFFAFCERPYAEHHVQLHAPWLDPDALLRLRASPPPRRPRRPQCGPPSWVDLGGVAQGGRDAYLFRTACALQRAGRSLGEALHDIAVAASACSPPFDPEVAREKVRRVYRDAAHVGGAR